MSSRPSSQPKLKRLSARLRQERGALSFAALIACAVSGALLGDLYGQAGPAAKAQDRMAQAHSAGRSAAIYPAAAAKAQLRFDHGKHAAQPCTSCHAQAQTSAKSQDSLAPTMQACASCHGDSSAPAFKRAPLHDCKSCHLNYAIEAAAPITTAAQWQAVRPAPMIAPRPQAKLKFSHAAHQQQPCASCHGADARGQMTSPEATQCATCHNDTIASAACTTCHLEAAGARGRIQTQWRAPGQLSPTKLLPDNHSVDWLKRHGAIALSSGADCLSCHAEQSCASCHQARGATPRSVHPPNFLVIHRVAAQSQEANCTSCHSQQTFCASCHIRTDHVIAQEHAPPPKRSFHPPGWLNSASANNHGVMAKRNINDCASCHQEQDCLSCHRGISPHPATYALSCKRQLEANPAPCAQCHTDLSRIKSLCR